jgi:hypothetical protein
MAASVTPSISIEPMKTEISRMRHRMMLPVFARLSGGQGFAGKILEKQTLLYK